ncbi:unnamed protein product [Phytophthora fragariaefolia]|uniref:Unnamed protein product n=1 Tax=Phytophthora fragariaefolia TaxID=1490495 RepID=A0A9W6XJN4_9STRA|nr:unnamed protein product [Phytophthora fragariaefolia]
MFERAIGCRWVFALNRDETGWIVRHKARLIAKGYSQRHDIDYEETYSPVASLNSIRAKFCDDGAIIEQCDVDIAFLYGGLDEAIFMELPQELMRIIEDDDEDIVCLLGKCLYGLRQASCVWNEMVDRHSKSMGFKPNEADPCVYTRDDNDQRCVVWLYVDDILIALRDQTWAYIEVVIKMFGQENPSRIPLDPSVHLTKDGEPKTDEEKTKMKSNPYRSLIGSLTYQTCGTRPHISVAVAKLNRILGNHGERHWNAGIKVGKYLLKTKNIGILYDGATRSELVDYSDAIWAESRSDRRSVSGMVVMMCGAPMV